MSISRGSLGMGKSNIYSVRDFYIKHKNYLNKGYEQISWAKWLMQFVTYGTALIYFIFPEYDIQVYQIILVFIGCMAGCWLIGYLWDKYQFYNAELEFSNVRNEFVKDVRKLVKVK